MFYFLTDMNNLISTFLIIYLRYSDVITRKVPSLVDANWECNHQLTFHSIPALDSVEIDHRAEGIIPITSAAIAPAQRTCVQLAAAPAPPRPSLRRRLSHYPLVSLIGIMTSITSMFWGHVFNVEIETGITGKTNTQQSARTTRRGRTIQQWNN